MTQDDFVVMKRSSRQKLINELKEVKKENQQLKKQKDDVVELIKKTPFLYSPFKQEVLRMLGEIDDED